MKGVSIINDKKMKKRFVKIDFKTLEKYEEHVEDLLDAIIAEMRRDEDEISWADVKKTLKKKGKL